MAEDQMNATSDTKTIEARIVLALQTAPETRIPPGFAARVAGQLPARPAVVLMPRRYGLIAAVACLVVLMVLMLAFAHQAAASSLYSLSIESLLCLQFVLLTVWIVARNAGYTLPNRF